MSLVKQAVDEIYYGEEQPKRKLTREAKLGLGAAGLATVGLAAHHLGKKSGKRSLYGHLTSKAGKQDLADTVMHSTGGRRAVIDRTPSRWRHALKMFRQGLKNPEQVTRHNL